MRDPFADPCLRDPCCGICFRDACRKSDLGPLASAFSGFIARFRHSGPLTLRIATPTRPVSRLAIVNDLGFCNAHLILTHLYERNRLTSEVPSPENAQSSTPRADARGPKSDFLHIQLREPGRQRGKRNRPQRKHRRRRFKPVNESPLEPTSCGRHGQSTSSGQRGRRRRCCPRSRE